MELKEDVWYVVDDKYRVSFIIDLSKATKLTESELRGKCSGLYSAKVFKWKSKSIDPFIVDINYRSDYKPDYLKGEIVHYKPMATFEIKPFDLASYKDNSVLTNNVIKEWVDARIAEIEHTKDSGLSRHIDSWIGTTNKLVLDSPNKIEICKGDNMISSHEEYNERYLIQQYFNAEEKKLTDERNQAENDLLKNTSLYKAAEAFILEANANKGYKCAPTVRYLIKDYLTDAQKDALSKLNEKYNEEVEEVRKKCRVVESLINISDTAEQRMDILRRYEIVKLPKMPK